VLMPNQSEAALLSGMAVNDEDDAVKAAQHLRSYGIDYVVVTLGDQGALLVGPEGKQRISAHQVKAVDATAAGDAFVAAFAVALAEGRDYATALAWGNAAGALAVTAAGAQPSLPTRAALEALLAGR
jgi:Sugar kinases, ribokinase family